MIRYRAERAFATTGLLFSALARPLVAGSTEVVFHAGDHKTGTTTVQAAILRARERLARQGVQVARTGQARDGGHHKLVEALIDGTLGSLEAKLLRAELARASPGRLLISSEAARTRIAAGKGHRLIDGLRAAGADRVQILFYLRSPAGKANSHFSQKTGALQLAGATLPEFLTLQTSNLVFAFSEFSDLAMRDDVELVVRPYSLSARSSIVRDFGRAIGVDLSDFPEPRLNRRFGPLGIEALRLLAAEVGPLAPEMRQRLRVRVNAVAQALDEEPYWGIDQECRGLLNAADRQTDAFARASWGCSWRDAMGEEDLPLNVYDPENLAQKAALEQVLCQMRRHAKQVIGHR